MHDEAVGTGGGNGNVAVDDFLGLVVDVGVDDRHLLEGGGCDLDKDGHEAKLDLVLLLELVQARISMKLPMPASWKVVREAAGRDALPVVRNNVTRNTRICK